MRESDVVAVPTFADKLSIGVLTRTAPRVLVDEVVASTERREKRRRLLPSRVVVYFVMVLALFFEDSYSECIRKMVGGLRFMGNWPGGWTIPTAAALCQARQRLGEKPMKQLFERVAVPLARPGSPGSWFGDLRLVCIDGVVLDAPDTAENREAFGRSNSGRRDSAFAHPRVLALAECGTHAIIGATIGNWRVNENKLLPDVMQFIEHDMLVMVDRGLHSIRLWRDVLARGGQTLFRVDSKIVLPRLRSFADGSFLSVLLDNDRQSPIRKTAKRAARGDARQEARYLLDHGEHCRVVEFTIEGSDDTYRVITSILDPDDATAVDIAQLYHQRWEIELAFDEIENHQLGPRRVLRSKSPEMLRQEIWGLLLTHYAIRAFMHESAAADDIDDDRLSFLNALRIIRHQLSARTGFSPQV